jgi:hypothetical protein
MASEQRSGPRAPAEQPDAGVASRPPKGGGEDRPGFDLGGATDEAAGGGFNTVTGGPKGSPASGPAANGRAAGLTDPSGSRSLGNEGDAGSEARSGPTDGSGSAS